MIRKQCAGLLVLLTVLLPNARAIGADAPPNVILIMADDVGSECFGFSGSTQYQTPHIDRMAERGLRFTHCYSQPLCTPSRVKLMTGLSNVRNYSAFSILNSDQRSIGQYMQQAGYKTMVAGKWQLLGAEQHPPRFRGKGTWPQHAGFDRWCLWQVDRKGSRYWKPLLNIDGKTQQFGKDDYGPDIVNRSIIEFMSAQRDDPFFVYYPMILAHDPFEPTPGSSSRTSENRQRNYEDMIAYMDEMVGRIVKATENLGISDRTLILFTTDNGTHGSIQSRLGGRLILGGKGKTTDDGTRVPLIALWPGVVPAGRTCADLVDFSDFLPTILEVAAAAAPRGLDGSSFLPQLRGERGRPREWIYCFYCPRPQRPEKPVRFARDQRWKLYGDGRLFDVARDPLEKNPLTEIPEGSEAPVARVKLQAALDSMPAEGQMLLKLAPPRDQTK